MHATHRSRVTALFAAAALAVATSACGSNADSTTDAEPSDAATVPGEPDAATVPAEPDAPAGNGGAVETSDNPIVLGFEVSGPEGTVIEVSSVFDVGGADQQEMDQTITLRGEPVWQLFTPFVDAAVLTLEVTEGGPATIDGFRGNSVDVEDPFAGYVLAEELGSAELPAGEITTFNLP
jgi:hypothetical protein